MNNAGAAMSEGKQQAQRVLSNFDSLEAAKKLFWDVLGYDRRNDPLSPRLFPPAVRLLLREATVFAEHEGFCVILARLAHQDYDAQAVSRIVGGALRHLPFAAFLFTDLGYDHWRFVFARVGGNPLAPKPTLAYFDLTGPNVDHHRTANRLLRLRTYDCHDEPVSYLQLSEAYQQVFGLAKSRWESLQEASQNGLDLFLRDVGRNRMLSRQEEVTLVRELDACGSVDREHHPQHRQVLPDKQADYIRCRNALVVANLRLCLFIAKRFHTQNLEWTDLAQEASLGLARAAELIDPTRRTRYITYAYYWAEQCIRRAICNQDCLIRIPAHAFEDRSFLPSGRMPRFIELTDALVEQRSLATDVAEAPDDGLLHEECRTAIDDALRFLSPRQRKVITLRFGLSDGQAYTLEEVGQRYNLTRERIRQIEQKALSRLKSHLRKTPFFADRLEHQTPELQCQPTI
jgi:RNA polymerase primary sigma factor